MPVRIHEQARQDTCQRRNPASNIHPFTLEITPLHLFGSIPALVTPMCADGAVDLAAFADLVRWQIDAGSSALVVGGSTGESGALSKMELSTLVAVAVEQAGGRVPVLVGAGAAATAKAVALCRLAQSCGADAVLAATPHYSRPDQAGLLAHFLCLADAGGLPVVLYNVPARTGCDLLPETVGRLLAHSQIIGIKEALPDPGRMRALLDVRRNGFAVLSGDDPTALDALRAGADGVISVVANAVPCEFAELVDAARSARWDEAEAINAMLAPLYTAAASAPNPVPIKAALALQGRIEDVLRLPLMPLSGTLRERLRECLQSLSALPEPALAAP